MAVSIQGIAESWPQTQACLRTRARSVLGASCAEAARECLQCVQPSTEQSQALLIGSQQGGCLRGSWLTPREGSLLGKIAA